MDQETYLTVAQVAERLQFSSKTIYSKIRSGKLRAIPFGRNYRITETALTEFVKATAAPKPQRTPRSQKERIARLMRAV